MPPPPPQSLTQQPTEDYMNQDKTLPMDKTGIWVFLFGLVVMGIAALLTDDDKD